MGAAQKIVSMQEKASRGWGGGGRAGAGLGEGG